MNRTITTTSTPRRQSLRHAALALCAVLVALVAASCTADALDGTDPGAPSGNTNPDDVLTFAVGPRPGFTEVTTTRADGFSVQEIAGQARNDRESARNSTVIPGLTRDLPNQSTAPATRAELTDDGTHWETGDILWLRVEFYQNKQSITDYTVYTSALKYDGAEWRYLTEAEAEDLNTGNIPNFSRLVRWPRGWKDWVDPGIQIVAYYAGSGKPDADGTITVNPTGEIPATPLITGGTGEICSPDVQPVPLQFGYNCSRVRIPAGYKVEWAATQYCSTIDFSLNNYVGVNIEPITEIPEQSGDTDVFLSLYLGSTAKLTRDNVSYTFTFPETTNAEGLFMQAGISYTLTPYTSGTQTPVADYDLTIADEAGLRAFAQAVNAGDRLPNGKPAAEARVLQTENIELTQGEWVPIGNAGDKVFRGAYNGNGNEISGLTITTAPQPDANNVSYVGLFGRAEGAVLTGIRLREVGINIPKGRHRGNLYVGSIAGYIKNSTLSLCTADGMVNAGGNYAQANAGGIAGISAYSTISRCRADVEIKAAAMWADAGGITGQNRLYSFILSCESGDGAVTAEGDGYAYAGGITGHSDDNTFIAFCRTGKNSVTVRNAGGNYAGGLVGDNYGNLVSCYSRATAEATDGGSNYAGAIVGRLNRGNVQHCYGVGATDKGTSNLDPDPVLGIVYNANPDPGDIFGVMTNYPDKVESVTYGGKTYYLFTTTYAPSATPAYGIIPQRAVWKNDGPWNEGDGTYPGLNIEAYEGK